MRARNRFISEQHYNRPLHRRLPNIMTKNLPSLPLEKRVHGDLRHDVDLSDMVSELRILLPGAQMLTAFLIKCSASLAA